MLLSKIPAISSASARIKKLVPDIAAVAAGLVVAVCFSLWDAPDGLETLMFRIGIFDMEKARSEATGAVEEFNSYYAKFYDTGGHLGGLGIFPAENMIKRRVVQDINSWTDQGKVLVYDRDSFGIESVRIEEPLLAVVTTEEVWFLEVQDWETRRTLSGLKANPIRVRYILRKFEKEGWKVVEYEVLRRGDEFSPLDLGRYRL